MAWICTKCHRQMSTKAVVDRRGRLAKSYDFAFIGADDKGHFVICQECWDAMPKPNEEWPRLERRQPTKHGPSFQELYEQRIAQMDDELVGAYFAPPAKPGFAGGIRELARRFTVPLCLSLLGWLILFGFVAFVVALVVSSGRGN